MKSGDFDTNKNGVFTAPNYREWPLPRGCRAEIATAYAGGVWFYGLDVTDDGKQAGRGLPCTKLGEQFTSEMAAVWGGINEARKFFGLKPGCAEALDAWHAKVSAGLYFPSTQTDKPMTTASSTETAAPAALELIVNEWAANGVCINPEIITIPGMPAKASCEFHLGVTPERKLVARFVLKLNTKIEDNCALFDALDWNGILYDSREEVIRKGLQRAAIFFQKNKAAIKALEEYHAALKGGVLSLSTGEAKPEPFTPLLAPLPKGRFAEIDPGLIARNPENHRKTFDASKAKELMDSIRQNGLLQPIAVRKLDAGELGELAAVSAAAPVDRYEIILGERRWRAHIALGLPLIEAKVYEGVSRNQAKAAALVENLQREEINAIEEAEGYRDLMLTENITQEQCALRLGRSRPVVANAVRVLELPEEVVAHIRDGKLTMAHGLALHKYAGRPDIVKIMAEECIKDGQSAGQLEEWNKAGYVPFRNALQKAGLLILVNRYDMPGSNTDWPEDWAKDADYQEQDQWSWICWNPAKHREFIDGLKAEITARQQKEQERIEASRKKSGIKSLDDLKRGEYVDVGTRQTEIADLLPESKVLALKQTAEKASEVVTVCTAPKFAEAIYTAMEALKRRDRAEKLPVLLAEARAKVKKWKKLGPAELALVLTIALSADTEDSACFISPASAKSQGVTIPAALKLAEYDSCNRLPDDLAKALKALAADPVGYARVMVDDFLVAQFCDAWQWERMEEPEEWDFKAIGERGRALLMAILDKPLGFLEDTASGRKKLNAQVKALPWYAAAFEQASKAGQDMGELEEALAAEAGEEDDE